MDDPRLAAALLTSSPDALAGLFDAYGDRLFRYCWSMLRSREMARVALRDTLLVAQAHIARLADPEDPESLGPWLYSLARAECRRHQAQSPAGADESPARLDLPAADARLMSWNAAMSLEAAEFEALDLACRHYVDLGQVLGLSAAAAEDLLDRARQHLERALGAGILAGRGPACPDRDALLADMGLAGPGDQPGPMTAEVRERVLEHADGCAACGPEVPRNVSATRIFALLPAPALTPQDRAEILAALAGRVPPPAPALAQAALVPAPAAPAPAAPVASSAVSALASAAPVAASAVSAPVSAVPVTASAVSAPAGVASAPSQPAPAPAMAAPAAAVAGLRRSALGPPLASYVRVPEAPARTAGTSASAPDGASGPSLAESPGQPVGGTPGASVARTPGASLAGTPGAFLAWNSGPSLAGAGPSAAPFAPAAPPAPVAPSAPAAPPAPAAPLAPVASPAPAAASSPARSSGRAPGAPGPAIRKEASGPRRVHRGRLVIAGAGVLVSGVVIASAIAMAGPGKSASNGSVTPTLAAGAATGSALQSSGLGAAGPASPRAPSGTGADHPAGTRLSTPPPLVTTADSKNQVMITTATQPLAPDQAPGARPNGGGSAADGTAAVPGTLQLSAGGVTLGDGNTGQITLTAVGGAVSWSASVNPPDQVSLSNSGGTLPNGQSITLTVQVSRGPNAGSAAISFQVSGSDTQVIPVTWSAQPGASGSGSGSGSRSRPRWHHHPSPPGPSPSSGTMSSSPPAAPSSLGPASWHQSGHRDPARSRPGRP